MFTGHTEVLRLQPQQMSNNPTTDTETSSAFEMARLDTSATQAVEESPVIPPGVIDEDAHSTHGLLSLSRSD